jgi:hypothetical protein
MGRLYELGKNNSLRIISIALFTIVLLCSDISIQANTSIDSDIKNTQSYDDESFSSSVLPVFLNNFEFLLQEDFDDGTMPPVDPVLGPWTQNITANDSTWFIDDSHPYNDQYCATIHRGDYKGPQDEWLITPRLNFSLYDAINLRFRFYTSSLTAIKKDVIDLNVGISINDGGTWTEIWNEDQLKDSIVSWTWLDSGKIDLSEYSRKPNIKIRFKYYSTNITDSYAQALSIDNIVINGTSEEFSCNAGGPYEISWSWNMKYGVNFHGTVHGGQYPFLDWTWDFGDGTTSKIHFSPNRKYNDIGTYNVTLTVVDSATPKNIAVDHTTVKVVETPPTCVQITLQPSVSLLTAAVKNSGILNVSYLNWSMNVEWGPSYLFQRDVGKGIISFIKAKDSTSIYSDLKIFWSGFVKVKIVIEPLNACRVELQQKVLIVGSFLYPLQSC